MKKQYKDSSMIAINIGDKVLETERKIVGVVQNIRIVPNGNIDTDKSLIALLTVFCSDMILTATADNFEPLEDYDYEESYPSDFSS